MSDARKHRVTFYLNDDEQGALEHVLSESGKERADYFRALLESDSRSTDTGTDTGTENGTGAESSKTMQVLEDALADTRQSKDRLEQLLAQSQATVNNMTRALPAGGETAKPWWRVW